MDQRIELTQKQILSQKQIQSLNILQMTAQELESFLEEAALENPVINLSMPDVGAGADQAAQLERQLEWLTSTDRQNQTYYTDSDHPDEYWDVSEQTDQLEDHLWSQLLMKKLGARERSVMEYIIGSLDSRGYFTDDEESVAAAFGVSKEKVRELLGMVQALEPAGIGARNLQECLKLQLQRIDPENTAAMCIVESYLDEVAKNHLKKVAAKMNVGIQEVVSALEVVKSLNPKPGNAFADRSRMQYVRPDAVVIRAQDHFEVLINDAMIPRISIDGYYQQLAKKVDDPETKRYLQQKIRQAREISEEMDQRSSTLSKVLKVLVERQQPFFLYGPGNRQPLKLFDLSDETGMHFSTVSRAMRGKYLQCAWGVFPLKYFLTSQITPSVRPSVSTGQAADEGMTPEKVQAAMQEIIDREDKKKPLSDEAISKKLSMMHMPVSRRTVNKYRQLMGIPDKSGRKTW